MINLRVEGKLFQDGTLLEGGCFETLQDAHDELFTPFWVKMISFDNELLTTCLRQTGI